MATPKITINKEQRLYNIHFDGGMTCWGFDNCFEEGEALAAKLGKKQLSRSMIGTQEAYDFHRECVEEIKSKKIDLGTWYDPNTPDEIIQVLETARKDGTKIRLFIGDRKTGVQWLEEDEIIGKVGRSTGVFKVPLIIASGEMGGGQISTKSILRIDNARTGSTLYQCSNYKRPELNVRPSGDKDLPVSVTRPDGTVEGNFKNEGEAEKYIAFHQGRKPVLPAKTISAADMTAMEDAYARTEIVENMARTLFVTAYANAYDNGDVPKSMPHPGPRQDWFEYSPATPKEVAPHAENLALMIENLNGGRSLGALYREAAAAEGRHDKEPTTEEFGYYLVMESNGSGVAWSDDHPDMDFKMPSYMECSVYAEGSGKKLKLHFDQSGIKAPAEAQASGRKP